MISNNYIKHLTILLNVIAAVMIIGCSNDETSPAGSTLNSQDNLTISILSEETVTDVNGIEITEAKCLIGEVELETEPSSVSINLPLNPFVVNLNSFNAAQQIASVNIPEGTYNKIKFQVHKPEDNETPPDPEFNTGESGNQRFSVIIKGIYNGSSFTYRSRKSANIILSLSSLPLFSNGSRNLTMIVNPSQWFINGSSILDPGNPSSENMIDNNIKNSFKRIFRDDNRDGLPDDN